METFCTSGPHSKYRAALTSSSFYQASPYNRTLRQNDYTLPNRNRHSALLWHQRSQRNAKPRSKICSIALATAAFVVLVAVLAIAGLAIYMGALRAEVPTQLLTFSCSAKILRGDRFVSHLQEKSRKYRQQLETLYHRSTIGPAFVSCAVEKFGEDTVSVYFKISLNRKKLPRSISNLEKVLRDILLNDSVSRRPVFRGIRFDPRSILIRQVLESDQKVVAKPKEPVKYKNGVLLKPTTAAKHNFTLTADLPVKRKPTVEELDFKEEDLPVIQGSFHISKTEADITEKKGTTPDTTTHKPKTTEKAKQTIVTNSLNNKFTTTVGGNEKISTSLKTTRSTTSIPKTTMTPRSMSTIETTTSTKAYSISSISFTIPPHSLNQEPWVPIQRATGMPNDHPINPANMEISPTVSLIELLHQRQPIYTSFTNPGLSFHSMNTETLGPTNMLGHPLPVNKIAEITEPSLLDGTSDETVMDTTASLETTTLQNLVKEEPVTKEEAFVEVETLKHVPGSAATGVNFEEDSSTKLNWEFLNGTNTKLSNETEVIPDKFYNNTLRAVITRDRDTKPDVKLRQSEVLRNLSSIFQNLASSLGIVPTKPPSKAPTPTTTTASAESFGQERPTNEENSDESDFGHGQVEVVDVDEESLMLQTQSSTKLPLVTLLPAKSNSGVGKPLRPRPKRPTNVTEVVENRSFPSNPFYSNLNIDSSDLTKTSANFVQTEVVTSVSTEINKVKMNKSQLSDFRILSVLNFETESYQSEVTPLTSAGTTTKDNLRRNPMENEAEFIRNPKMNPKENFTSNSTAIDDEISVFAVNSSVSSSKTEKFQADFNILTEDKLKQLSEISKIHANVTNEEDKGGVISNKAISATYTVNQAGFKVLTKTFNKIPSFSKDEDRKPSLGFSGVPLNVAPNKTECNNFTIKCGDGQCLPESTRCNQLMECKDGTDEKNCNCADYLRSQFLLRKICDGIIDCWDLSDENLCEWCNANQYVCRNSKTCIDKNKICDGVKDCPNGDDERHCVTVAPTVQAADQFPYYTEGYLMVRKRGKWGKFCLQNFAQVIAKIRPPWTVSDLGQAVCKAMTYQKLERIFSTIEPRIGATANGEYYELSYTFQNLTKSNLSFQESNCESGEVVKLQCQTLECGTRPQAPHQLARRMYRIVGGGNAELGAWPWQAALYKEGEFQCGATLLSDRWLLSAGHCFFHSLEEHWVARLGALRRGIALPSPYEQLRPIIEIVLHPGYVDTGFINDISLLKMETPIVFSDYVRPICLPFPGTVLKDGRICTVIGWGQLFEVGRIFPDTLQEVQVPIISTAECRKRTLFLPLYKVTDDMFCAGYERGGRDACLGDSGGPLMCSESDGHWILQGVTSNGYGCARANRPGVYTKVANYVTWIQSYLQNNTNHGSAAKTSTCFGHRCPLGECLPKSRLCNGYIECSDGSDEKGCPNSP